MKIHIVQRDDTFETIADKYSVSVQDLVGMNTHINHLAPLVSGLKVKVPSPARKEAPNVAQHIQKYYPNIDTETINLQTASTAEPVAVKKVQPIPVVEKVVTTETVPQQATVTPTQVVEQQATVAPTQLVAQQAVVQQPVAVTEVEEVVPIPLKPLPTEVGPTTGPNDGVKVFGAQKSVEEFKVSLNQGFFQGQPTYQTQSSLMQNMPPVGHPYGPSPASCGPIPYGPLPTPCGPVPYGMPYATPYNYPNVNPYPTPYGNPYGMSRGPQDERFFMGGFGSPFYGGWGWGGSPFFGGWGWGGSPFFGGWGGGHGGWGWGGGHGGWRSPSSCSGAYPY